MAKGMYAVVDGSTRKIKKQYAVVDGVTRKIKKMYAVVDGVTRLIFNGGGEYSPVTAIFKGVTYGVSGSSNSDYGVRAKRLTSTSSLSSEMTVLAESYSRYDMSESGEYIVIIDDGDIKAYKYNTSTQKFDTYGTNGSISGYSGTVYKVRVNQDGSYAMVFLSTSTNYFVLILKNNGSGFTVYKQVDIVPAFTYPDVLDNYRYPPADASNDFQYIAISFRVDYAYNSSYVYGHTYVLYNEGDFNYTRILDYTRTSSDSSSYPININTIHFTRNGKYLVADDLDPYENYSYGGSIIRYLKDGTVTTCYTISSGNYYTYFRDITLSANGNNLYGCLGERLVSFSINGTTVTNLSEMYNLGTCPYFVGEHVEGYGIFERDDAGYINTLSKNTDGSITAVSTTTTITSSGFNSSTLRYAY